MENSVLWLTALGKYPEMAEKCKRAFSNMAAITNCAGQDQSGLVKASGFQELPVFMMLLEVTANAGQKIGTLIDLASDSNYITHRAANTLKLRSEKITFTVYGVRGMAMKVNTKRYLLRVRVNIPRGTEYKEMFNAQEAQAETKNPTANKQFLEWWKWYSM